MTDTATRAEHAAIDVREFLGVLAPLGGVLTGIPCSHLGGIFEAAHAHSPWRLVSPTSEGEAVAIACGVLAAGGCGVVAMQNSGLGSALDPITSLAIPAGLTVPLVVSHRGHPDVERLPQHAVMGSITRELLELAGVPTVALRAAGLEGVAALAAAASATGRPFGVVVRKGDVAVGAAPIALTSRDIASDSNPSGTPRTGHARSSASRESVLNALLTARPPDAVFVATTGHTSRHLFGLSDDDRNVYLAGSMGYASAFALGLDLQRPAGGVVVIDGDGSTLMHLGNLATIGAFGGPAFRHVIFDNGAHGSTGGQPTVSAGVAFPAVATGLGYQSAAGLDAFASLEEAVAWLFAAPGPALLHVSTLAEPGDHLPRVGVPLDVQLRRLAARLITAR